MNFLAFFDEMWWVLATGPHVNCTQILRRIFKVKELPVYSQEALPLRINPILGRIPLPLLLLPLRRWLSPQSSDFSISSRSPIRLRRRSFLLTMCHACSGIYHNLYFPRGLLWMRPAKSIPQKANRMLLCLPLWAVRFSWASSHASPRAHRSCLAVSSGDLSSNFKAQGLRSWGILTCILFTEQWTFIFSDVCLTQCSPCESYSSNQSQHILCPFLRNRCRVSCGTQLNFRTLFTIATALLSPPLFRLFVWLFFNLPVREWALLRRTYIPN